MMRDALMAPTAISRSASPITIAGAFPPSSRFTLVILAAAADMMAEPVSTLPVKLIMPTRGEDASALPAVAPRPCTMLITPGGNSVRANSSQNFTALWGVSSLGLMTMVLPDQRGRRSEEHTSELQSLRHLVC